jgi:hypothetical protein
MVGGKTKREEEEYGLGLTASRGGAKRQTAEQKAKLPERWKRLEEMFWALEMAVSQCSLSLRHASSLNLFPRLAERVRTVTHYTFDSSHLAQISAVYPNAYHAKRSGASATTTPTSIADSLSSEIADVFLEVKDHSELFTRNINFCLEKRRVAFRAALLRRLESLHNDFLRTKENTNSSSKTNNTKRRTPAKRKKGKTNVEETGDEVRYQWHKDFPLDEVEDIEEAAFIEEQQPSSPFTIAQQQQTKLAASSSQTTTKSKDTNSPLPTMEDLVRKVREKEERLAESATRVARKKHINGLVSLVEMTRGFYCAEKKSVMHLHVIATKLVASANTTCAHQSGGGSDVFSSVEEVKKMLTKLTVLSPEWCSIINIAGTSYLKINSKIDLLATKKRLLQTLTASTEIEIQPMQM